MAAPEQSRALSTWTLLFVDDLDKALRLYHEVLGIPIRERGADYVVLGRDLVLEVSDHPGEEGDGFDAPGVVGVYVAADALPRFGSASPGPVTGPPRSAKAVAAGVSGWVMESGT